jgi:hypothetical protein
MSRAAFAKIAAAKANKGGTPIRDGRYVLQIKEAKLVNGTTDGACFIAVFDVLKATAVKDGIEPNAVGSTCDWVQKIDKHLSAKGNVKEFVLSLFSTTEKETSDDEVIDTLERICNEDPKAVDTDKKPMEVNPAAGMIINAETFRKAKKGKPEDIMTLVRWSGIEDQGDLAGRKAALHKKVAAEKAA